MAILETMMPAYGAAAATDVSIDATVSTSTARGMRSVVFTTASIGYWFYIDSAGTFVYSKTSNGGASWGAAVTISAATTIIAYDVWFDQWTPSDSGTLIHTWYFDSTNDIVRWRSLNTSGDTLGTERACFTGASAVAGRGAFCSGTKTRSGYLYVAADIDAGAERVLVRSIDSGTTWSAQLAGNPSTFVEATLDIAWLFPATGTGDNNDMVAIYLDTSATSLSQKLWDSSAATASESVLFGTLSSGHTPNGTDLTGQSGLSGAVRLSDGHIIVVEATLYDNASEAIQVTDVPGNGTTAGTDKTNIITNIDDIYYPAVFIDQNTDDIYVAYQGKRDGSEVLGTTTKTYYTVSTDGGTNWSAGDTTYQIGATSANVQTWAPLSGPLFYVGWRVGTTLVGCAANAVTI